MSNGHNDVEPLDRGLGSLTEADVHQRIHEFRELLELYELHAPSVSVKGVIQQLLRVVRRSEKSLEPRGGKL